jgi:hypothetical protein
MYEQLLNKIIRSKELAESGERMNIPYPFSRLNEYLAGIDRETAIGVLGGTGVGKSKFVRFLVYHIYRFHKETGYKVKIPFFCMEDGKERVWQFVICHYLFELYGITITHKELMSRSRILPDFIKDKLIEAMKYFEDFEKVVIFIDGITEPTQIIGKCKEFARRWGHTDRYTMNVDGVEIEQKRYISDIHVIAIFDNMSNIDMEDEDGSEQQAILKFCKHDMRLNLCGKLKWTCIMIMQLDFESERQSFNKNGETVISKLEPSLASIGDSKRSSRSFHLIFSLFAPSRFELLRYPVLKTGDPNYYDIALLGNTFRSLRVIKSNDSDVGMRVPLYFNGISEVYEELPPPNTTELKKFYESFKKQHHIQNFPASQENTIFKFEENEEIPF